MDSLTCALVDDSYVKWTQLWRADKSRFQGNTKWLSQARTRRFGAKMAAFAWWGKREKGRHGNAQFSCGWEAMSGSPAQCQIWFGLSVFNMCRGWLAENGRSAIEDLTPSVDWSSFTVLGISLGYSNSKEAFTLKASKVIFLYRLYVEWKAYLHLAPLFLNLSNLFLLVEFMGMGERLFLAVRFVLEFIYLLFILIQHTDAKHSVDAMGIWANCLCQSLCKVLVPKGSEPSALSPGSNHRHRARWWPCSCHGRSPLENRSLKCSLGWGFLHWIRKNNCTSQGLLLSNIA